MIQKYVDRFINNKHILREKFREEYPKSYRDILDALIPILNSGEDREFLTDVYEIDPQDFSGTIIFILTNYEIEPTKFWYIKQSYGSCHVCDTLMGITEYIENNSPTEEQLDGFLTIALHLVQNLKVLE